MNIDEGTSKPTLLRISQEISLQLLIAILYMRLDFVCCLKPVYKCDTDVIHFTITFTCLNRITPT